MQRINTVLYVLVIVGLVICVILSAVLMTQTRDAALLLAQTNQLSQELRQSSDDLTRFIRTYTVTGNASYWSYFQRVIRIRDGIDPLPDRPWRNFWDLYVADGVSPRGFSPPSSILSRMYSTGFVQHELNLLEEAKSESDALIDLEDVAYNAMNGRYRPTDTVGLSYVQVREFSVAGPPNQTYAMQLVHGIPYHQWKGRIMRPIDEFTGHADQRIQEMLQARWNLSIILIALLSVMLACLILLLAFFFGKVSKDTQTHKLLKTMLPSRVVDRLTVAQFQKLKMKASEQSASLRQDDVSTVKSVSTVGSPVHSSHDAFPVLYSEFIPLAWVAFADIVDFTPMCRSTPADMVISILNQMFSLLDLEASRHGVEKIKTIGDAFMCAKLTALEEGTHAARQLSNRHHLRKDGSDMIDFLLKAIDVANSIARPHAAPGDDSTFSFRVGLHIGPVASGIVGFERPLYDLFGDTVNIAARLEATGRPNRIQILETTLQYFGKVARDLEMEPQAPFVDVFGLGSVKTRLILAHHDPLASAYIPTIHGDRRPEKMSSRSGRSTPLPEADPLALPGGGLEMESTRSGSRRAVPISSSAPSETSSISYEGEPSPSPAAELA